MKRIVFITFLMSFQMLLAQDITKNVGDFTTVRTFDKINVLLIKSTENKIVISGHNAADVEVVNKGNDIKIRMKFSKLMQGDDVSVTLYYKNIDQIEASEGSYVSSQDTFKATAFELNAKEGAKIKVNLDVQKLKTKLNSGGETIIGGKATNHVASITSGGTLSAKDLITAQSTVSISAGGDATINASDFVEAKTTAGGTINIHGNPKQVNKTNTAGGAINIIKS